MASLFPNQDQNGTIIGPNVWSSVTMGLGDLMLSGEPLEIFESNGYIVIKAVGSNGKILLIDPETGLVMDLLIGNETSCGSYCYKNQQAEWAEDVVESILDYGQNIMNFLINGDGTIDLSQLAANTKNGLMGFLGSTMISLGIGKLYAVQNDLTSMYNLYNNVDVVFGMLGTCFANAISVHGDNAGVMSSYTVCVKGKIDGEMVTGAIRINPNRALDAAQLEIELGLIVIGVIAGPTDAIGGLTLLSGAGNTVLSAFRGQFNDVFSDHWLQVKINDQQAYTRYLIL